MRAFVRAAVVLAAVATVATGLVIEPVSAEETPAAPPPQYIALALPVSTADCLEKLEAVLQRAVEVDLLDDQIDEAELHLEKFEDACYNERFNEALNEGEAIERIVASNK
jgi:hypothetical protein